MELTHPTIFTRWKQDLSTLLNWVSTKRSQVPHFYSKLFLFFSILNFSCYWLGMLLIFPGHVFGSPFLHYAKISIPVGIMGALFDSLSFYITLWIITHALESKFILHYVLHLALDFIIAIIATFWVLLVFVVSGWIVNQLEGKSYQTSADGTVYVVQGSPATDPQLEKRSEIYRARVEEALQNPYQNWRNISFGIIMGLSAMLPTCLHLFLFFKQLFTANKPYQP